MAQCPKVTDRLGESIAFFNYQLAVEERFKIGPRLETGSELESGLEHLRDGLPRTCTRQRTNTNDYVKPAE
ncbi:unnamed protein product, partial [Iphiclides podalirius]